MEEKIKDSKWKLDRLINKILKRGLKMSITIHFDGSGGCKFDGTKMGEEALNKLLTNKTE